jgi:methylmalonyl-CoA mutase C-terminal domain/subunit
VVKINNPLSHSFKTQYSNIPVFQHSNWGEAPKFYSWRETLMERKIPRILLTKAEQDCHDRGVRYVATKLREAGYEVIYTNFLYPEEILNAAIQEDVDVIGVSSSTLGHIPVLQFVSDGLKKEGREDISVIVGGIIPDDDEEKLAGLGVRGVFGPGSTADEVIEYINRALKIS